MRSDKVDDFNMHEVFSKQENKFDEGKVRQDLAAPKIVEKKGGSRAMSFLGMFVTTTLTISSLLLSKVLHTEHSNLVKLNDIVNNK